MYSIDVFDTLLSTKTINVQGIYLIMQWELAVNAEYRTLNAHIKQNFFVLRINAENTARNLFWSEECQDINLYQVYECMALSGMLSEDEKNKLCLLEKRIFCENVVGIKRNIDIIKEYRKKDSDIILLADTCLDSNTVRRMLVQADDTLADFPLYVSSEYKKRQKDGSLFWELKSCYGFMPEDWIHLSSDKTMETIVGNLKIGYESLPFGELTEFEKDLLSETPLDIYTHYMIGTARNLRTTKVLTIPEYIGISLAGPILVPYVQWILDVCAEKEIKRLYFVARDGYVLMKIAEQLIKKEKSDVALFYLYGSRRAWGDAAIDENGIYRKLLEIFQDDTAVLDILHFANILHIPEEKLVPFLPPVYRQHGRKYTKKEAAFFSRNLMENEVLKEIVLKELTNKRERTLNYLRQAVDCSDNKFAFVELNGTGVTQDCLGKLLYPIYGNKIRTFYYFKMKYTLPLNYSERYVFFPSNLYMNWIIEPFCRAPHGQTIDYRFKDGKYKPVLDSEGVRLSDYGFFEYLSGIQAFTDQYMQNSIDKYQKVGVLKQIQSYFSYIARKPSEEVLNFISDMPFDNKGTGDTESVFAPRLSDEDIRALFFLRRPEEIEQVYKGASLEYSLLRASKEQKELIKYYQRQYNLKPGIMARTKRDQFDGESNSIEIVKKYGLPYDLSGERIIVYGAGKIGKKFVNDLESWEDVRLVMWVDSAPRDCGLYRVCAPENIKTVIYDRIIIAIKNEDAQCEIRNQLEKMKIPKYKVINIFWEDFGR